jgi:hypothetical protein
LKKGWKDHLLRSGVPLEYEVARVFAGQGFSIDADFSFLRRDVDGFKEWSTDINATWFGPSENDVAFEFSVLTECKYRSPEKFILLLEDPNESVSPITLGGTVYSIDAFVDFRLPLDTFVPLESELTYVYKAVELHDGGAFEEDLRHGIQQLRYATPALLRKDIDFVMSMHPDDWHAVFLTKILVTNAPIWILNRGIDIATIKSASEVGDIARKAETVILYSDFGPDFEDHTHSIFQPEMEERRKRALWIKDHLKKAGKNISEHSDSDPVHLVSLFSRPQGYGARQIGTQFFITTLSGLPALLASLKKSCLDSYGARQKPAKTRK